MRYSQNLEPLLIPEPASLEEIRDDQLKTAYVQSAECGSILPLIKQELKCKIQAKRLKEGNQELSVSFTEPLKYPLTKEEMERKENRKKNNRISARRCRQKKKEQFKNMTQELQELMMQNEDLTRKVTRMEHAKSTLLTQVTAFLRTYNIDIPPSEVLCNAQTLKQIVTDTRAIQPFLN